MCPIASIIKKISKIHPNFTILFIEFSYSKNRFSLDMIIAKTNKYQPTLINSIWRLQWKVDYISVIIIKIWMSTHIPPIETIHDNFKISKTHLSNTL